MNPSPESKELIRHEVVGTQDGPWLVFVHGLTCDSSDWQPQIDALGESYRCLLIDSRGHGASGDMTGPYNVANDANDLADLLTELDVNNAVLIGHSRGVRIISATAVLTPQAVGGLVFVDGSQQGQGDPEAARKRVFDKIAEYDSVQAFSADMFSAMFPPGTPAIDKDAIMERAARMPKARYLELLGDMVRWDCADAEETLGAIQAAVGVVQSTTMNPQRERRTVNDGEMTPYLELIARCIPTALFDSVANTGHFTQLDAPERVNAMIETIAARLRH